jgi:hypothetical protein
MYAMYYALMLRCWQLIKILVRTNHPCLRVGCHNYTQILALIIFILHSSSKNFISENRI